jgi:DNA-binding IclR family transcriptional regulator
MAGSAPAVSRTVALLDFLAARPTEAFSLSELARRLDLNKSTTHAVLTTLADAGYVARHPVEKSYTLGPALVAIGEAAAASPSLDIAEFARDEMRGLADEFGVQCVASRIIGAEIVIIAHTGTREPLGQSLSVGHRLPFVPPLGTVFVAWSAPTVIDAWLQRLGTSAKKSELARYRQAVAAVRDRGFSIVLEADARRRLGRAVAERDPDVERIVEELGHEEYILLELERSVSYQLSLVAAPVFGPDGGVVMAVAMFGFRGPLDAVELTRAGSRVLAATRAVTHAIHGHEPDVAGSRRAS